MDLGIKGRTALILGGGGGLGSAIALSLAREGVNLALADINEEALDKTLNAVRAMSVTADARVWDVSDLEKIDKHIQAIFDQLGPIDILINNTGGPPPTTVSGQRSDLWSSHFNAMVLSVIKVTDSVLPSMRSKGWGRIVTSTSSGVIAPIPNLGISNALRLSLVGWSKTLAREVGRDGVTTNIILPGRIATDRIRYLDEQKAEREGRTVADVVEESTSSIPVGRYGRPDEYAKAVTFLASDAASYITGSVIRVDGGLIASI